MKKDIEIPKVEGVYIAAVYEYNKNFKVDEWTIYLINDLQESLETVLIVSKGESRSKKTSVLRKKLEVLPAKSYAKLEFLHEDVLQVDNIFQVSYFLNNQLLHKDFKFQKNSLKPSQIKKLPLLEDKGILAK
ncbi:hypothetical protein [Psychroflexus aestuariivivens]|uniref:hypothetical protein n=1 Tax=Psychroflexus aestuariivivens TaxID=1795040 RepID=UPI000FD867D6|nr:hypothetical protein [Psychroflexus aestuariivivens]